MGGRSAVWGGVLVVWLAGGTALLADDGAPVTAARVYYDYVNADGTLGGGATEMLVDALPPRSAALRAAVTTILSHGDPANRIDIVCVGDGYTAAELPLFAQHADAFRDYLFSVEPFTTYANFFNMHRVDVVSNESGVDHDPTYPLYRDTALDMGYWCSNIERLLCVNVSKAYQYAYAAPDVDSLIAIANSTKYGGAGHPDQNVATLAGGNSAAGEVAVHELGHSLGDLADEYDYGDGTVYTGPERPERNVSILTAEEMAASGTKWTPWLETYDARYGGYHWTYEGAHYAQYGIYRPTSDSKMRSLGRPFNLPSAESLVIEIYKLVDAIDATTPARTQIFANDTLTLTLVQPIGHVQDVTWALDGTPLAGQTSTTLDLHDVTLTPGTHTVTATVVDNTPFVRDVVARETWLRSTRSWTVVAGRQLGDLNCDGVVDFFDIDPFVLALTGQAGYDAAFPDCEYLAADADGDGGVDFFDIDPFVGLLVNGG